MARRTWLCTATVAAGGLLACAAALGATAPPRLTTATLVGDRVTLSFSGPIRPGVGNWTIIANGKPVKPLRVLFAPKRVQLVLPAALYGDDTLRIVGRVLRARSGARLRIVDTKPANRSPAGCTQVLGSLVPAGWNEGPTDWATFLPPTRFRVLSVMVDFADAPTSIFHQALRLDAVDSWMQALSYGRAGVQHALQPGVVRMPKNYDSYAFNGSWGSRKTFFQDVVQTLDSQVDFARFDAVFVSAATPPFKAGAPTRVPPDADVLAAPGTGVVADGRELRHFGQTTQPGTAFRSLLHLAGLPPGPFPSAGVWDSMSPGSRFGPIDRVGLLAWHRQKLGWLDPTQIRCLGSAPVEMTLTPTWSNGGVKMVVAATSATTAVVLENRQLGGLDAIHCRRGVLAYEVRTNVEAGISVLAADASNKPDCGTAQLPAAPYDVKAGDAIRVGGAVSFQVLSVSEDGSYRLRVTR
jgi:hypothetical protein